jgi:hypothetical protein
MTHSSRRSWQPWFNARLAWRGSRIRGDNCDDEPHPMRHIDALQCHEWMLTECAALDLARQQREDNVVSSIITISSAALLAIPGLFFGKDTRLPSISDGWALYSGFGFFALGLAFAFAEQILSSSAYKRQVAISRAWYRLESTEQSDEKSVSRVGRARLACIASFAIALSFSALGLSQVRSSEHGQSSLSATATTATTPPATYPAPPNNPPPAPPNNPAPTPPARVTR